MIALVIAAFFIVMVMLNATRWGLNLKAVGANMRSALLLGVATERTSLSAFLVCGALAGIAGSYRVLFTFDNLRPLASGGIGFLGLLVVLLLSIRLLWVPLIAFAFAAILTGSTRLQIALQAGFVACRASCKACWCLFVILYSMVCRKSFSLKPWPMMMAAFRMTLCPLKSSVVKERSMNEEFLNTLGSIVGTATPLVIASLGETITERAGVVNLSLDGSLALAAVLGFAAAWTAQDAGVLDVPDADSARHCSRHAGRRFDCPARRLLQHQAAPRSGSGRFRADPAGG